MNGVYNMRTSSPSDPKLKQSDSTSLEAVLYPACFGPTLAWICLAEKGSVCECWRLFAKYNCARSL